MAKQNIIEETGIALGLSLQPNEGTIIGLKEGFPVQILTRKKGNTIILSCIIRYDNPSMDKLIKETLSGMPELKGAGIKKKDLDFTEGMISFNIVKGITGFPKVEKFVKKIDTVVKALKGIITPPGLKCRVCGQTSVDQPLLINGIIDRVCPGCIEKLETETKERQTSYDNLPMNLPLAILVAALLAVVGAIVYGGIIIATNRMYWIIAIGIGVLIGKGAGKASGRTGIEIQILSGLFTVISVLLGLVFCAAYGLHKHSIIENYTVNWLSFAKDIPAILVSM
jgi:hypothetical protein